MDAHSRSPQPGRAAWWTVAATLITAGAVGAGVMPGASQALLLVAVVATVGWWALRGRGRTSTPPRTPTAHRQPPSSGHLSPLHGPAMEELPMAPQPTVGKLRMLSTPQLCWTWRVSYVRIQRSSYPSELGELAELRSGCLEELQRRDPAAFARWFPTARAASDPARFFCPRPTDAPRLPTTPPSAHRSSTPPADSCTAERSADALGSHRAARGPATTCEPQRSGAARDAHPVHSHARARPDDRPTAGHTPTEPAQKPEELPGADTGQ